MTRPIVAPPSPRRDWDLIFVAGLTLPVTLVVLAVGRVAVYAPADAGISLANSDSLIGRGIRPAGHLPGFAIVTTVARLFVSDLATFRVLAVVTSLALAVAFYAFVRNRTRSPLAEVLASLLFSAAPTTAEAIGWYGLTMLFGIALALLGLRAIDDWLSRPTLARATVAGLALIATSATHAVPFVWLLQTAGLFVAGDVARLWIQRNHDARSVSLRHLYRASPPLVALLAAALLLTAINSARLESAVTLSPSLDHLGFVSSFGFRDNVIWLGGLGLGLIGAPVLAARSRSNRRLALWGAVAGWVAMINLVVLGGDDTYVNRPVYLLAVTVCVGFAIFAAHGARLVRRGGQRWGALMILTTVVVLGLSGPQFATRLNHATAFYNRVSSDELAGIRWLSQRNGSVLVAPSDADFYDGTTISWLTQGLAQRSAVSATEGYRNLIRADQRESDAAALVLAGSTALVQGGIALGQRASHSEVLVLGRHDSSWLPVVAVRSAGAPLHAEIVAPGLVSVRAPAGTALEVSDPNRSGAIALPARYAPGRGVDVHVVESDNKDGSRVAISLRGLEPNRLERARLVRARSLLEELHVRWIWTPRASRSQDEFVARGHRIAYENSSVVIFDSSART